MTGVFAAVFVLALALALAARGGHGAGADPREFFAARGQFGAVFFFLLSVGETYSIGSVLGFPGGVMAGGPTLALWFVGYILLAAPVGFLLYPLIWRAGQRSGAITLPALFGAHFGSVRLGRGVAFLLVILMLPLGTMQIIGLDRVIARLVVSLWPGHGPDEAWPLPQIVAVGMAFAFIATAGMRGAAFVSLLKDALMVVSIFAVAGAALLFWPRHAAIPLAKAFPAGGVTHPLDAGLLVLSTVALQAVGFCMAPQTVAAVFSARSVAAIRRAQVWLPLYMLLFPLLFSVSCYALTHGVARSPADGVFLAVAAALLPGWAQGVVLAGVALTALVWLGAVCLSLSAIVTRDLLPGLPAAHQRRAGLVVTVLYLLLSVAGAAGHSVLIASLNTLFYLGLIQLLPGLALIVMDRPAPVQAVCGGVVAGLVTALGLREVAPALYGINPALPGLLVNGLIAVLWRRGVVTSRPVGHGCASPPERP